MVLDGVRDHNVLHITDKNTSKEMWEVNVKSYQYPYENLKIILKDKMRTTNIHKSKSVTSYLTIIQGVRYEIAVVGEKPVDSELVLTTLNRFTNEW